MNAAKRPKNQMEQNSPTFVGDNDARLARVEPDQLVTCRPLWLVFHRDLRGSDRLAAMRNFLTAIFEN